MSEACRICSCIDTDCTWCVTLYGAPCFWQEPDLCSACAVLGSDDITRARARGHEAIKRGRRRSGRAPGFMAISDHGMKCLRVATRMECQKRRAVA